MRSNDKRMFEKFREFAEKNRLWDEADRLLVAVSGGPDSVALLRLLLAARAATGPDPVLVHLDHRLRGEESRDDARWVRALAARLKLPGIFGRRPTREWARKSRISLEEAARRARFDFFEEVSQQTGVRRVALGHQADDQAETVLMRLLRGTGPRGLGGMRPRQEMGSLVLLRPLLPFWRSEILAYLEEIGQDYRIDSSNRDKRIFRNRVRRELLPALEKNYNSRIKEILVNLARMEAGRAEFIKNLGEEIWPRIVVPGKAGIEIDVGRLLLQPTVLREELLRKALLEAGCPEAGRRNWSQLNKLLRPGPGRECYFPGGIVVRREYDRLWVGGKREVNRAKPFTYRLSLPGETLVPEARLKLVARKIPRPPGRKALGRFNLKAYWNRFPRLPECRAYFSLSLLKSPLTVRSRRPGDRYRPLGLEGTKKVKDILIDGKIAASLRERIPLVTDREGIIWIVGGRPGDLFRLGRGKKETVELTAVPAAGTTPE